MGAQSESILATMGMNLEPFSRGIDQARTKITDFTQRTSEDFDRVATSGRAMHGVLEKIGEISPTVGIAIAGAFSAPLAGLELLKMGLGAIKEHYAEISKAAKEAIDNEQKLREVRGDWRDAERRIQAEMTSRETSSDGAAPGSVARLRNIENVKADIAEAEEKLRQAKIEQDRARSGLHTGTLSGPGAFREAELNYERQTGAVDDLDRALDRLRDTKVSLEDADKRADKEFRDANKAKKDAAEEEKELDQHDREAKDRLYEIIKRNDEADKQSALHAKEAAIDLASVQDRIAQHFAAPFQSTLSEVAQSRGPYAALARRAIAVTAFGKRANLAGRKDLVDAAGRELYGYDTPAHTEGILHTAAQHHTGLMDRLRDTGVMAPDMELKSMNDAMQKLLDRADNKGILITTQD